MRLPAEEYFKSIYATRASTCKYCRHPFDLGETISLVPYPPDMKGLAYCHPGCAYAYEEILMKRARMAADRMAV